MCVEPEKTIINGTYNIKFKGTGHGIRETFQFRRDTRTRPVSQLRGLKKKKLKANNAEEDTHPPAKNSSLKETP
jgi:hypothetical protein